MAARRSIAPDELVLLVLVGPNSVMLHRPTRDTEVAIKKFKVERFQVVVADGYLRSRLDPDQAGKTPEGHRDPHHVWDYLRWYALGLDIVRDDWDEPVKPGRKASDAEVATYNRALCRAPIDLDKVANYFDPVDPAREHVLSYEPRGIATVTARQAKWWINNYPWHARNTHLKGYVQLIRNSDERGNPGKRNEGKSFVDDTKAVEVYARNRTLAMEELQRKNTGTNPPRSPWIPRNQSL